MNHIPKFLISKKKRMSSDNNNRTPKLERRFALRKNIDYDPPDTATCQSLRTRSLDLVPDSTSFRLHGVDDGEIDLIFGSLGLSPDDFSIPAASWEAHKARSASYHLPRDRERETLGGERRFSGGTGRSILNVTSEREGETIGGERRFSGESRRSISDVTSERERKGALGEQLRGRNRSSNDETATTDNKARSILDATRSNLEINDETTTNNSMRSNLDISSHDMYGERERETLGERRFSGETATSSTVRSNLDVTSDDSYGERGREALGDKRGENRLSNNDSVVNSATNCATRSNMGINDEMTINNKARSNSDIGSEDLCSEKGRETLGEKCVGVSEEVVTNNDRFDVVNYTRLRSDVNRGDTYGERERETLGERRGFYLSNKFQDSVRVSDEIATNNDRFMATDPINIDNTRSVSNISSEDMYNNRYADGDRGGIKGVRTNLMAPPVSPMVVNDTSSMFGNASTDWELTGDFNNVGASGTKFANVGSVGGIKGVRPPLLAPPPSISARVVDNTSSTWDIMRSFAPDSEENPSPVRERSSYYDDEEEREARPRGSAAFLSESCSFTTTSNDDDSSSTTTEPMSNISPNGRFKRAITYWQKGELLGRGSFGSVYEGIADGGYFIAVKEVSLLDQGDMGRQSIYQLEQEIALLSQFEHENIVQYYGTDKDEAHLYIFLELVTKGSLLSLYQKYHLRDSQVSSYTRQILHGLKYLHERNVVHRDIKCANILVGADGSVKLADFGLAKATKLNDVKSCKGTAFWMAPEVVRGRQEGYGLPADIWSLGCTVLEMLTHRVPYSPLECFAALYRIGRGEPPPIPDSLSRDARDFISRCLKVDPNDRSTATQLLEHSFVKRPLPTSSGSSSPYHSVGRGFNSSSR